MPPKAIVNSGEASVRQKRLRRVGVTILEEENTKDNEVPLRYRMRLGGHLFGKPQTT